MKLLVFRFVCYVYRKSTAGQLAGIGTVTEQQSNTTVPPPSGVCSVCVCVCLVCVCVCVCVCVVCVCVCM